MNLAGAERQHEATNMSYMTETPSIIFMISEKKMCYVNQGHGTEPHILMDSIRSPPGVHLDSLKVAATYNIKESC
jgi:hypothetical protein